MTSTTPSTTPYGATRGVSLRATSRRGPTPWLLLPALALFCIFAVVPLVGAVGLSLSDWDGLGTPAWAGMENWASVFTDPVTWTSLTLTLKVMVGTWLVQMPVSLLLGVYIARTGRLRAWLALFYFIPLLLSSAAVALMFKNLLDPHFGLTSASGWEALSQNWLGDPDTVLATVIFIIAWHFVPLHTLLFQAGVRQIPAAMYEAAAIDGAGGIRRFFSITLPQLKYTIVTSSTLMLVGGLTYFDLVFVLTAGGPGYSTRLFPLHMYLTGFQATQMGRASAIAVLLAVLGLCLSLGLTRASGFSRMQSQQEGW